MLLTGLGFSLSAYLSYQPKSACNELLISLLDFAGMLAPFCVTLLMIFSSGNRQLKQYYLSKLFDIRRMSWKYLPLVLLILPFTWVLSIFLSHWLFSEPLGQFNIVKEALYSTGFIPAPLMLFGAPLFEELAWKGYGIDSLRSRYSFFKASVVFSLFWMLWHVPSCFPNGFYGNVLFQTNILFGINYLVSIMLVGFIINWLWYRNNGFILAAVFLHASVNFQGILHMGQIAKCIQTVIFAVMVLFIIALNKKLYFGKPEAEIGRFTN